MTRRVALVTGGARGIGRAIVTALRTEGWTVAYTYRTRPDPHVIDDTSVHAFAVDLRDHQAVATVTQEVERAIGPIEGLVNNAGVRNEALLAFTSDAAWEETIDTNIGGAFRCCRAVLPLMMHRRRGAIVNVSSLSAVRGLAGQSAYAASKAALLGLTRSLAREAGKRSVRVNAVLPGFVQTDMTNDLPAAVVAALRGAECLPRGTVAEDVASLVTFLMSEKAAAITGQAMVVDAGASA